MGTHMKIYLPAIALGALALCAEAIDEPKRKCQNFISINQVPQKASRGRRSPLFNEWGEGSGSGGDGSDGADETTVEVTTLSDSTQTTAGQTTEEVTDAPGTTEQVSTATEGTKGAETTVTVEDTTEKAIVIVLDETGSMQNLGGPKKRQKNCYRKIWRIYRQLRELYWSRF